MPAIDRGDLTRGERSAGVDIEIDGPHQLGRMHFPRGVAAGDLIALVNTGGYLMHIRL